MAQLPIESVAQPTSIDTKFVKGGKNPFLIPFILVTSLFFLWGMAHNLDSILIPHLKKACELNNRQSTLVDTAVFFAYFIMAIPAGIFIKKWGYKSGIITGLLVFALGAFLFIPAANSRSYQLFLIALFVIGCGLAMLETAANPYAAILGPNESAGTRLNLAASFNGLAALIAPVIGTAFILSGVEHTKAELNSMAIAEKANYLNNEAAAVKLPYLLLGLVLVTVAVLFYFFKLPEVKDDSKTVRAREFFAAFRYKHLKWAVIAQFCYVGAQVCVTSFFIRMAKQGGGIDEKTAGYYLGLYGCNNYFLLFLLLLDQQEVVANYYYFSMLVYNFHVFGHGSVFRLFCLSFFCYGYFRMNGITYKHRFHKSQPVITF